MGLYAIECHYLSRVVAAIKADQWPIVTAANGTVGASGYLMAGDGVAVVPIMGPMMKGSSKYPHANTIDARRAVRAAVRDEAVGAILLHIDSPGGGGMVAGTAELADDVRRAGEQKPVVAYGEDLLASAAYWVASQARSISANKTAEVGSIGTVAVVEDTSGAAAMEGVTVHVVSTGAYKGAFSDGAPVTAQHLEYLAERVAELNGHFLGAVTAGRGLSGTALEAVSDGRVWGANTAKELGLVDAVEPLDAVIGRLSDEVDRTRRQRRQRRARAVVARSKLPR